MNTDNIIILAFLLLILAYVSNGFMQIMFLVWSLLFFGVEGIELLIEGYEFFQKWRRNRKRKSLSQ